MPTLDSIPELAQVRAAFCAHMEAAGAAKVWEQFTGRIAVALSGGGARGAYEAGALLAFQDAKLPTHILTATSVGSVNAAGFAASSNTLVGNAEEVIERWMEATPQAVGIEWTRYAWMLGGLVTASAGFGNLIADFLKARGYALNLPYPAITWGALGVAGLTVMLFYDRLPYVGYVVGHLFQRKAWKVDARKAGLSLVANVVIWGFLIGTLFALNFFSLFRKLLSVHPLAAALIVGGTLLVAVTRTLWRGPLSNILHRIIRLPLRPGLFQNFERARFLRRRLSEDKLRASPMRVLFTVTDLEKGTARFFANVSTAVLAADPGADENFVKEFVCETRDLIGAIVASSALPIAFEPIRIDGCWYSDGGLCTNQPLRPAVRLGADVVFLVMMDTMGNRRNVMGTFVDVGISALDILMRQNLLYDLRFSANMNAACERAAEELGLRPEEVEISLGARSYRYIKAIAICPPEPLPGSSLDFSIALTRAAILQGYNDASAQLGAFLVYAREARFGAPRRKLDWSRR